MENPAWGRGQRGVSMAETLGERGQKTSGLLGPLHQALLSLVATGWLALSTEGPRLMEGLGY